MPLLPPDRRTPDERLEAFHLWTGEEREPSALLLWLASGVAVIALLGLYYLARAVL